jgi:hypothetical protein
MARSSTSYVLAPTITSTPLSRCTLARDNRIVVKKNLSVHSDTSSEWPGWGIGLVLLGATGNILTRNRNLGGSRTRVPQMASPRSGGPFTGLTSAAF